MFLGVGMKSHADEQADGIITINNVHVLPTFVSAGVGKTRLF